MGADTRMDVLREALLRAATRAEQDRLLDAWFDIRYRAQEFDAQRWGFPSTWCASERAQLARNKVGAVL